MLPVGFACLQRCRATSRRPLIVGSSAPQPPCLVSLPFPFSACPHPLCFWFMSSLGPPCPALPCLPATCCLAWLPVLLPPAPPCAVQVSPRLALAVVVAGRPSALTGSATCCRPGVPGVGRPPRQRTLHATLLPSRAPSRTRKAVGTAGPPCRLPGGCRRLLAPTPAGSCMHCLASWPPTIPHIGMPGLPSFPPLPVPLPASFWVPCARCPFRRCCAVLTAFPLPGGTLL
jgi:hypothetical protein